jgi:hypothetical protein
VQILTRLFGGESAARDFTPAWDGGIYWAGQLRSATPAEQATTKSIAIFYLSRWRNAASADNFAHLYASELGNKYSGLTEDKTAEAAAPANGDAQQVFSTNEGPVVITTRDKMVFVAESFPLDMARKLTQLVLDSQGSGTLKLAALHPQGAGVPAGRTLSAGLVRFFARCGVMRAAVDAALRAPNLPAQGQPAR